MALRLVGVAVTGFDAEDQPEQLSLFDDIAEPVSATTSETAARKHAKTPHGDLLSATDKVKNRFGEGALRFGRELRLAGRDTGSSSKNPADYK